MQSRKIPATIVTGFLGSGKTTLLRHLLTHAEGRRIANQAGDVVLAAQIGCNIGELRIHRGELDAADEGRIDGAAGQLARGGGERARGHHLGKNRHAFELVHGFLVLLISNASY